MRKKYRLKKGVKIILIAIILLSIETLCIKVIQDRVQRIDNGELKIANHNDADR